MLFGVRQKLHDQQGNQANGGLGSQQSAADHAKHNGIADAPVGVLMPAGAQ